MLCDCELAFDNGHLSRLDASTKHAHTAHGAETLERHSCSLQRQLTSKVKASTAKGGKPKLDKECWKPQRWFRTFLLD